MGALSAHDNYSESRSVIPRKSAAEIAHIRASCHLVALVKQTLEAAIRPGVTTLELDALAEQIIRAHGAVPAFKGYRGFPASICASANARVVHGFPDRNPLQEGDILSVDVGVRRNGYYGDGAFTVGIGRIRPELEHLLATVRACLDAGIQQARVGGHLSDISHAIQTCAQSQGFSVVREFGGHGIGRALHEEPFIPNHGSPGQGPRLRSGFVLAIEPIINLGNPQIHIAEDGWTTTTCDQSPSAHCEHTVLLTPAGPEILTLLPAFHQQVKATL